MNFRKLDYAVFYVLTTLVLIIQLFTPDARAISVILIFSIIPALVLGTITNLVFRKKVNS